MQCYVYVMHHLILSQNTANSDVRVRQVGGAGGQKLKMTIQETLSHRNVATIRRQPAMHKLPEHTKQGQNNICVVEIEGNTAFPAIYIILIITIVITNITIIIIIIRIIIIIIITIITLKGAI